MYGRAGRLTTKNGGFRPGQESQWTPIMCGDASFSGVPLWYAHWDDKPDFGDFHSKGIGPFGGWSLPVMKQYKGSTQMCNVNVDLDYRRPAKTDDQTAKQKPLPAVVGVSAGEAYPSLAPSFLTFDSRLTAAQISASPQLGRYSFVWGAHATHVSAYRANPHNPDIKLGYYFSYDRFEIPRGQDASSPFEYWNNSEHFGE